MSTSSQPTAIRFTDKDRERLDNLALFYGTNTVAELVRIALENEDLAVLAFREGPHVVAFDNERRLERYKGQYRRRIRDLRKVEADLASLTA